MNSAIKPFFVLLVIVGIGGVFFFARSMSKIEEGPELVSWREDFAAAKVEAEGTKKPVLAYFTATWCPPCQKLKSTTWADKDVAGALGEYVPVRVDIDAHQDMAAKFAVSGIPHFVVLDAGGNVVKSATGYMAPGEFLAWLKGPSKPAIVR